MKCISLNSSSPSSSWVKKPTEPHIVKAEYLSDIKALRFEIEGIDPGIETENLPAHITLKKSEKFLSVQIDVARAESLINQYGFLALNPESSRLIAQHIQLLLNEGRFLECTLRCSKDKQWQIEIIGDSQVYGNIKLYNGLTRLYLDKLCVETNSDILSYSLELDSQEQKWQISNAWQIDKTTSESAGLRGIGNTRIMPLATFIYYEIYCNALKNLGKKSGKSHTQQLMACRAANHLVACMCQRTTRHDSQWFACADEAGEQLGKRVNVAALKEVTKKKIYSGMTALDETELVLWKILNSAPLEIASDLVRFTGALHLQERSTDSHKEKKSRPSP